MGHCSQSRLAPGSQAHQVDGHSAADIDPRMARLVRALGLDAPALALGARHPAMLPSDELARTSQAVAGRHMPGYSQKTINKLLLLGNFLLIFASSTARQRKVSLLQKAMLLA